MLGRALAVFPLGLLTNCTKLLVGRVVPAERENTVTWKHMYMMWHGGVCRGGVSLWMAYSLEDWLETGVKQRLVNATFILICVFLFLFGGSTSAMMTLLRLPMGRMVEEAGEG